MNVLITHPDFEDKGGVSGLYNKLKNKFKINVIHFIVGKRPNEKDIISQIFRIFRDYYKFIKFLKIKNIDLVHVNPSLDFKSLARDGMFIFLAKINKIKTVVFFHGWAKSFEARIEENFIWIFKLFFGKSDAFIVLAEEFRRTLRRWGISKKIYKLVNVISEDEVIGFNIHDAIKKRLRSKKWRVLFLSRIIKEKGIYETIEAISILKEKYPTIELIIAGDGKELSNALSLVHRNKISNVIFMGYVKGDKKRHVFENSHVFCFPTYSEGLPESAIEAIAYGLPIITRPVGGIADFFENGTHGFITESLNPIIYARLIERLFLDKELYKKISLSNYKYAQAHFLASNVALRLEAIHKKILRE
ncbi:MAG: glycosyltransferase family 4 protein [Promethearchaeota archaeon]